MLCLIAEFDGDGNLPSGIHWATWAEVVERYGITAHRRRLLEGLRAALADLRAAGCSTVYVDGSFITTKQVPNDYDACWEIDGVRPELLHPVFLTFDDSRRAQKTRYYGEFFPASSPNGSSGETFLEFFQTTRDGAQKGIIAIDLRRFP